MLFFVVILFLGNFCRADTCPNAGLTPLANDGMNNYVIDWLELVDGVFIPFPFAINRCTSHSVVTTRNYFHTCVNNVVSTQEYTDLKCTVPKGNPEISKTINYYAPGEVGYFECDGLNTYVELYVATNATGGNACSNLQHIFAGLNGCVDDTEVLGQRLSIYCDSKRTLFEWFVQVAQSGGRSEITDLEDYNLTFSTSTSMYPSTSEYPLIPENPSSSSQSPSSSSQPPPVTDTKNGSISGLQTSSQYPSNSELPSSSMFPNMSSSLNPSTVSPNQICGSDFYCLDWIVKSGGSCQRIATLQGTNIGVWGSMGTCQEQVSAAVGSNLALWLSAMVTIVFTLTH